MSRIKILTITTSGLGKKEGISTVILDYYSYFNKNEFQLDLIASGEYNYKLVTEFQSIGVNIRCLPSRKISVIEYIKALITLLKKEKYDAIYIHGSSSLMCIELIIAKIYKCNIRVVHSHNTTCDHKKLDKLLRPIFYRSYTKALACGTDAGKWLYGNRPFEIIKNGRNIDIYKYDEKKRREMRKKLGISDDTIVIGHVGNFNKQKNQAFLIDLMKENLKKDIPIKMYLMGEGTTKENIMAKAKQENVNGNICFTGSINNVPDMLQAMDIMLLPSLHEGLPLVVVEWQMAGLPCIVSDAVTRECAYTDLVCFLPLDNLAVWSKKITTLKICNRSAVSELAIQKARENGFDLKMNAQQLQQYFVQK